MSIGVRPVSLGLVLLSVSVSWRIFAPAVRTPSRAKRNRPWVARHGSFHRRMVPQPSLVFVREGANYDSPVSICQHGYFVLAFVGRRCAGGSQSAPLLLSMPKALSASLKREACLPSSRDAPRGRFHPLASLLAQTSGFAFRRARLTRGGGAPFSSRSRLKFRAERNCRRNREKFSDGFTSAIELSIAVKESVLLPGQFLITL